MQSWLINKLHLTSGVKIPITESPLQVVLSRIIPPQSKWNVFEGFGFNPMKQVPWQPRINYSIPVNNNTQCLSKQKRSPIEFASYLPLTLLGLGLLEDGIADKCHWLWPQYHLAICNGHLDHLHLFLGTATN